MMIQPLTVGHVLLVRFVKRLNKSIPDFSDQTIGTETNWTPKMTTNFKYVIFFSSN